MASERIITCDLDGCDAQTGAEDEHVEMVVNQIRPEGEERVSVFSGTFDFCSLDHAAAFLARQGAASE